MGVVFVTGMSGAGKSTVLGELGRQGCETVDTDYGFWCHDVDGDVVWDEPKISSLLAKERGGVLYLSGTVSNQGRFYDQFDAVVLLSAPHQVLFDRLATRTTNGYGKSPAERAEIGRYLLAVEPLLRESSTHEINTDCSVEEVVAALIKIGAGRATQ
ncbi:AAA family ATPase [Pseudarthrobacter sp. DSP2-3-2b1]|uniref:AAA family ATPase n=1 Tax=Pseudarthrobacter sp. DSP2-3-2b1 TaxID=2804661 RepID=UPI003CFA1519